MPDSTPTKPEPVDADDDLPRKKARRAGQACDRCRARKIKCDGKLPSCSPCETARVLCKTTDRTSNRTIPRGYLENLEAQLAEQSRLQARVKELETRLLELEPGNQPSRSSSTQQFLTPPEVPSTTNRYLSPGLETSHNQSVSPRIPGYPDVEIYNGSRLQTNEDDTDPGVFEAGEAGKGWYLGSASGMIYMNSIKNAASSVLGIELDLSDFSPLSKSVSGKSMPSLLSELHSHRSRKPSRPHLPPKDLGIELVNDFFATINLLCPVLHRPSFYRELNRCYDDPSYVPSSAFVVQYNMIMAIAARVRPPAQSHYPGVTPSHYTVASATTKPNPSPSDIASRPPSKIPHDQFYNRMLPYFPDLLHEPSLPDLQALLLLMVYLIGIYKMGHLWHLSRIMSAIAYELGLHRSDANWTNFNPLEREMRKRVFFLTVGLDLKVANSLGRPPSFRLQDSDVSLPAYMDDDYIDETGSRPMPEGHVPELAPAVELAMLIRISCSVTEKLFSVTKGPGERGRYVDVVLALEKELIHWKERAPPYIKFDVFAPPDQTPFWIANAGLHLMYNEMRLLIRHPSMGRLSPSPGFSAESLKICAEASRNILAIIDRFRDFRQLECHPQSVSTIVLASLTILYSLWDKKDATTKEEIEQQMALPLDILDEIGQSYGPTRKLHQALANLVAATIQNLEKSRHGAVVQGVSFGSSTQNVGNPPMHLPLRVDASFYKGTAPDAVMAHLHSDTLPSSTSNDRLRSPQEQYNRRIPIASLPWPVNVLQSDMQPPMTSSAGNDADNTPVSGGTLDDPMLWGSLEWTGGWDDFLNAIAM